MDSDMNTTSLANPRGTASRTEGHVDRWQHCANSAPACSTFCSKRRVNVAHLRASAWVTDAYFWRARPSSSRQVLITDARHYIKHFGARAYKPVLGNGLVTSEGEFWHRQRKLIQPVFLELGCGLAPPWANLPSGCSIPGLAGKTVRINDEFSTLTSSIALQTLFDLDDDGDREQFNDTLRAFRSI